MKFIKISEARKETSREWNIGDKGNNGQEDFEVIADHNVVQQIRVIDFDGMGGKTYEYYCGCCKADANSAKTYCGYCGSKFEGVFKKDTWGL